MINRTVNVVVGAYIYFSFLPFGSSDSIPVHSAR